LDGWEEGRRNRDIEGARIFAGVKRTADEGREVVKAEEILAKIERGEDVVVKDKIIEGDLDLSKVKLNEKNVKSRIEIVNSEIHGELVFINAVFSKYLDLSHTKFNKSVLFTDVTFIENIDFSEATFSETANFKHVHVGSESGLDERTSFAGAHFDKNVNFAYTHFWSEVTFNSVNFGRKADFMSTNFYNGAIFSSTQFNKSVYFSYIDFNIKAWFKKTKFEEDVTFEDVVFNGNADFIGARFGGCADFQEAHFRGDVLLSHARFKEDAYFVGASFDKNLKLERTRFITGEFEIEWDAIKEILDCDDRVYLALVKNFKNLGWFDDADNCYYEYRNAKMKEKGRPYLSEFWDVISFLSCGYGVRPGFTIACVFIFIYIFGSLFWYIDKISVNKLLTIFIKLYILNSAFVFGHLPKFGLQNCNSFLDKLYLSMMIFIGQTPSNFDPTTGFLKFAAIIEGILGYLFLALFVVVLARKFIR
jgi:hypothetical protein